MYTLLVPEIYKKNSELQEELGSSLGSLNRRTGEQFGKFKYENWGAVWEVEIGELVSNLGSLNRRTREQFGKLK